MEGLISLFVKAVFIENMSTRILLKDVYIHAVSKK